MRHGIRYPKKVPKGWPMEEEIKKERCEAGALTSKGGMNESL